MLLGVCTSGGPSEHQMTCHRALGGPHHLAPQSQTPSRQNLFTRDPSRVALLVYDVYDLQAQLSLVCGRQVQVDLN